MLSDINRNKVYVMMAFQPAVYNVEGNSFLIIDTKKNTIERPFNLKGGFTSYGFKDNLIYTFAFPKGLGFKNVPDAYIATINRDTYKVNVLTKNGIDICPIDLELAPNGKIYMLSNFNPLKGDNVIEPKISIYNTDGSFVKEIPIDKWCDKLEIDKDGIAYINHIGQENQGTFSGEFITVLDTNRNVVIDKIKGFNGCSCISIKDDYLFVGNYNTGIISVFDIRTREKIGSIELGDTVKPTKLVVVKGNRHQ